MVQSITIALCTSPHSTHHDGLYQQTAATNRGRDKEIQKAEVVLVEKAYACIFPTRRLGRVNKTSVRM